MSKKLSGYKAAHTAMRSMTLKSAIAALEAELNSERPRLDLISRLVGKINRLRGSKLMRDVMASLSKPGKKSVDALLVSRR